MYTHYTDIRTYILSSINIALVAASSKKGKDTVGRMIPIVFGILKEENDTHKCIYP